MKRGQCWFFENCINLVQLISAFNYFYHRSLLAGKTDGETIAQHNEKVCLTKFRNLLKLCFSSDYLKMSLQMHDALVLSHPSMNRVPIKIRRKSQTQDFNF